MLPGAPSGATAPGQGNYAAAGFALRRQRAIHGPWLLGVTRHGLLPGRFNHVVGRRNSGPVFVGFAGFIPFKKWAHPSLSHPSDGRGVSGFFCHRRDARGYCCVARERIFACGFTGFPRQVTPPSCVRTRAPEHAGRSGPPENWSWDFRGGARSENERCIPPRRP